MPKKHEKLKQLNRKAAAALFLYAGFILGFCFFVVNVTAWSHLKPAPKEPFYTTLPGVNMQNLPPEKVDTVPLRVYAYRGKLPESPFLLHGEYRRCPTGGGHRRKTLTNRGCSAVDRQPLPAAANSGRPLRLHLPIWTGYSRSRTSVTTLRTASITASGRSACSSITRWPRVDSAARRGCNSWNR